MNVLVTGASRGIGAAVAVELAGPGKTVFGIDKSPDTGTCSAIERKGGKAVFCRADVTDPQAVDAVFSQVGTLDVLVLCAGIPFRYERLAKTLPEEFEAQWRVQVHGAMLCCRAALPLMGEGGHIVFLVSNVTEGEPPGFMAPYVTAKYGLMGFSRALAVETAKKGIRVHRVHPGMTDTDLIRDLPRPVKEAAAEAAGGRLPGPEDVAREVAMLL
jgi:3-oxoacyl-[acyl-carrier protein] reductase